MPHPQPAAPAHPAALTPATASATIGPFFPERYVDANANDLTTLRGQVARGELIEITGCVTQHDGRPLHNVVLEIWQADANGVFSDPADPRAALADPNFYGWGRAATDREGQYYFRTVKPGGYPMDDGSRRAPHVNMVVLYSGLMRELHTVLYFAGEAGNESDPVLACVQPPTLRTRLVAAQQGPGRYRFDIRLRGEDETPFFDD